MSCYYSNITYRNSKYILFLSIPSTTSVFSSAFVISSEFCCLYCGCLAYLLASPFPLKEFFVFCPIPIFCSKIFSLFHNLFFSYSNHSLHTHASSKKELNDFAERPYHHLFSGAVYFCWYQICFHQKLVLFYLVNQIKLNDMLFAQTISPFFLF